MRYCEGCGRRVEKLRHCEVCFDAFCDNCMADDICRWCEKLGGLGRELKERS